MQRGGSPFHDSMQDRFDYATYWWIIDRLRATHRCLRFADVVRDEPDEPYFLLRHDVDYSPNAALRMAEQEAGRGVAATYFLLLSSDYYNLLTPQHSGFARRLVALGHEVGLHYDLNFFLPFPQAEWPALLRSQVRLLSELAGSPVLSIALHQPALNREDPFREDSSLGLLNAYDDRFIREMEYMADSCRAWRDRGWDMLESGDIPRRLHLGLHPVNWSDDDRDRQTIYRSVHDELIETIRAAGDELLTKIAVHSGALEHEARTSRGSK